VIKIHEEKENETTTIPAIAIDEEHKGDDTREEVESEDYIPITRQIVPNTDE
jgi:hypothetical protein